MILRWRDLIGVDFYEKFSVALGALLVIIPNDLSDLSREDRKVLTLMIRDVERVRGAIPPPKFWKKKMGRDSRREN